MSKRLVSISLVVFALLLWPGVQVAHAKGAKSHQIAGKVVKVDAPAKYLVVKITAKGKSKDLTFLVDRDTKLMRGSQTVVLAGVQTGDKATVTYQMKAKQRHAERIALAESAPSVDAGPKK